MPQFDSGAAEPIGRSSEGLLLRLLHSYDRKLNSGQCLSSSMLLSFFYAGAA